ncbi:MAG: SDR family NAD(P)-dependent oxidoreductase [Deltaproteobacteria bacterium]|nr:SDR family NAD(P)-dependent oxidoreductase [Deltaproteobacteria bacterium]
MHILVTGGAGFIGSHLVEAFLKQNARVRVLDSFLTGKKENLHSCEDQIEVIRGDVRDKEAVKHAVTGIDYIFHEAALKTVPESFDCPKDYNDVNIQGTLNLLEAAVQSKIKKFVYASSSSVYGDCTQHSWSETDRPQPISPYGLSKLSGEQYGYIFQKNYGLPFIGFRYFNVFGPRQPEKDGYSPVIPKFISSFLREEQPPIYGDGKQSRDFTYIDNVVLANVLAIEYPKICGVFNVGVGDSVDLLTIVDLLNVYFNKNIKPRHLSAKPGDVRMTQASLTDIKKQLNYQPSVHFQEGLKKTIAWIKDTFF